MVSDNTRAGGGSQLLNTSLLKHLQILVRLDFFILSKTNLFQELSQIFLIPIQKECNKREGNNKKQFNFSVDCSSTAHSTGFIDGLGTIFLIYFFL